MNPGAEGLAEVSSAPSLEGSLLCPDLNFEFCELVLVLSRLVGLFVLADNITLLPRGRFQGIKEIDVVPRLKGMRLCLLIEVTGLPDDGLSGGAEAGLFNELPRIAP